MSYVENFKQPTVQEVYAFFKGKPKRAFLATPHDGGDCLIAVPILETGEYEGVSVLPDEDAMILAPDENPDHEQWVSLDPTLKRLADYFDRMDGDGCGKTASAGACVRIIERFAKKEGIAL